MLKKYEKVLLLVLSIVIFIVTFIFTYEFIFIQKEYVVILPVAICIIASIILIIEAIIRLVNGERVYRLEDNKIIISRKNKIVNEIEIEKIDLVIKYIDDFNKKVNFIKFKYLNKNYRININETNSDILEVFNDKIAEEKTDYSRLLEFILRLFEGL